MGWHVITGVLLALCVAAVPAAAESTNVGPPSHVRIAQQPDGSFKYLVNGREQVFIGMGYDAIYRYLPDSERAAHYRRDFSILRDAGVNTITGWDADKGYEQDKFDEITLDVAYEYGIGVVMPLNLPPEGDYEDALFVDDLLTQARSKISRFKKHPALRLWGVGNEVFTDMPPDMYPAFEQAYLKIADLFHQLDPQHPVIYREAEDVFVPRFADMLRDSGDMRPWLLYGMNVYDKDLDEILNRWPDYELDRPVFVSEFGAEGATPEERAQGYLDMWRAIRAHPDFVMGGAPYVWTTEGPEPTDKIWGLMDDTGQPVDGTFGLLSQAWRQEIGANRPPQGN